MKQVKISVPDPIRKFLDIPDPNLSLFVRIRILPSKTFIYTVLDFFMTFLTLKNDGNVRRKSNKQKKLEKRLFFVGVLKITDEKSRIRIRIC